MQASAVPEELRRFRSRSRQLAGELDASLARLSEALADFRQAPCEVAVSLGPLEGDVARWAGEANRLGAWVGEVGDAFAAADASARPEVVRVGDEAALMVGPTPAELRPPPLVGLLGLLDLDPTPWVEARFPALAARRRPAHARLAELHARRRAAAVADYVGSAATSDRFGPTAEAVAGDIAAATAASRATPAEVAAFVALLDRHAALGLAREVAEVLRQADAQLRPAERRYLRAALAPLRIRLDAEWPTVVFSTECATPRPRPAGLDAALAVLAVPDPPRRTANVAEGFANGMVVGAFDEEGYDNGWGEAARVVGQLVSGYLVYGDVRDAGAHLSRGQWGDSVW
ncbi:MAG TPA: hypothetical protein VFO65_04610, partial [Acidimicrobiales bacterium]|nr:hypothetical protein [Acidimicrobiales bacterium]